MHDFPCLFKCFLTGIIRGAASILTYQTESTDFFTQKMYNNNRHTLYYSYLKYAIYLFYIFQSCIMTF